MPTTLRDTTLIAVSLTLLSSLAPLQGAEPPGDRWIVRGGPQWLVPTGDEAGDLAIVPALGDGESRQKAISDGLGFGLELEYLATRHVGIEATAHAGDFVAELTLDTDAGRQADEQDVGFAALTLGVNWHLTPGKRADFHLGAFAQRSDYDDVTHRFPDLGREARLTFADALGWGLKAGLDVELVPDRSWFLHFSARHLREPLDVKPAIGSVYLGYRF